MTVAPEKLRAVPLFADLPEATLASLALGMETRTLAAEEALFHEGDPGEIAYVLVEGRLEVTNAGPWQPLVVGESRPGDLVGEMALLRGGPRSATVTARVESILGVITRRDFETLLSSGSVAAAVYQTLLDRWEETRDRLRQGERIAQLGVLAAGVAHELNNPAAAVGRSAAALGKAVQRMVASGLAISSSHVSADAAAAIQHALSVLGEKQARRPSMGSMDRLDLQAALELQLAALGLASPGRLAAEAVGLGADQAVVSDLVDAASDNELALALEAVLAAGAARQLTSEIGAAARQISAIVATLGSYSRLDRPPTAEVDVVDGIEQTLKLLSHRLEGLHIVRQFEAGVRPISATETELNQVWTNLVANAADAAGPGGVITLRVSATEEALVVEVEDDGPGIPADDLERIFYAFYTTKPPGKGVGLGLAVSQRIVVVDHHGAITATSEPGRTVFGVTLPYRPEAVSAHTDSGLRPP